MTVPNENAMNTVATAVTARRVFAPVAAAAGLWISCAALASEQPTIADLVPEQTIGFLSIDDYTKFRESFDASNLGKLWATPSVQTFWTALREEEFKDGLEQYNKFLDEMLEAADVKREDLSPPSGPIGMAIYFVTREKAGDKSSALPKFEGLASAWYGDKAEQMINIFEKGVERVVRDGSAKSEEETYAGTTIYTIRPVRKDEDGTEIEHEDQFNVARVGGLILVGTSAPAVKDAIDRAEGKGGSAGTLAGTATYKDALKAHPASSSLRLGGMIDMVAKLARDPALAAAMNDPEAEFVPAMQFTEILASPMTDSVLKLLGVKGARSATVAVGFGSGAADNVAAEFSVFLDMPPQKGIMGLIEPMAGMPEVPAFISGDATGVSAANIRLSRLMEVVRAGINEFPEEMRGSILPVLDQAEGIVGPLFAVLGPEIYGVKTIESPLSVTSSRNVTIVRVTDDVPVKNLLTAFGAQAGFKPADFEGNQIFVNEDMGPAPIAIGVGGGWAYVGAKSDVENLMRQAANPSPTSLSKDASYTAAMSKLKPGATTYFYEDTAQNLRYVYWQLQDPAGYRAMTLGALGGLDPEMLEGLNIEPPKWASKLPPIEDVLKFIGPSVGDLRWTESGMRSDSFILGPIKAKD
ncbi:MAG: hypothetical protein ACK55O_06185 [Phycisphaerales bacterium]|jgi:hypothetical protein|nr:hypothetical protein [Phycisphaeraceae bacterium]